MTLSVLFICCTAGAALMYSGMAAGSLGRILMSTHGEMRRSACETMAANLSGSTKSRRARAASVKRRSGKCKIEFVLDSGAGGSGSGCCSATPLLLSISAESAGVAPSIAGGSIVGSGS